MFTPPTITTTNQRSSSTNSTTTTTNNNANNKTPTHTSPPPPSTSNKKNPNNNNSIINDLHTPNTNTTPPPTTTPTTNSTSKQPSPPSSTAIFHSRMARNDLFFLGEGGFETSLIFKHKIDLQCFASFPLYLQPEYGKIFEDWARDCFENAQSIGNGVWLETKTWRANADWGARLGFDAKDLAEINTIAVKQLLQFREKYETPETPIVISGCVGPRRDGYVVSMIDSPEEYRRYHTPQIETLRDAGCDVISIYTLNHVQEAIGATLAARDLGMPIVVSFTIETDGNLATHQPLESAIQRVDEITQSYPLHYAVNCAHPFHIARALPGIKKTFTSSLFRRVDGFFPNSSQLSHAELETAIKLDEGQPELIGEQLCSSLVKIGEYMTRPKVIGGCCGTSLPHLQSLARSFRDDKIGEKYRKGKLRKRMVIGWVVTMVVGLGVIVRNT
jgi:homocysteine S-methyltransferase